MDFTGRYMKKKTKEGRKKKEEEGVGHDSNISSYILTETGLKGENALP
jgi:hypothetical protein